MRNRGVSCSRAGGYGMVGGGTGTVGTGTVTVRTGGETVVDGGTTVVPEGTGDMTAAAGRGDAAPAAGAGVMRRRLVSRAGPSGARPRVMERRDVDRASRRRSPGR